MPDFHGWGVRDERTWSLHVGYLPGRKSVCLYELDGSVIRTLAFFKSEREAARALWCIDRVTAPANTPYEEMGA